MSPDSAIPPHEAGDQPAGRAAPDAPAFAALRGRVATALHGQASQVATRWEAQSRIVALREALETSPTDTRSPATSLVESLAGALGSDGATSDDLIALGLAFGAEAHARGGSLHHALKGLDLLSAMVLYVVEMSVMAETAASAADGVRLGRRLQQASSLLTLAVTKGYTQAMNDTMRDRFRHLRHDLRNPLGTIKSVLAMMDDETMPAEARSHPRFRAMATRNARSLGDLIADRLSDTAAVDPALVQQRASLRTIARGVQRDLRAEAAAREVAMVVGGARSRVMVDAIGLELLLHELLFAALQEASAGDELRIEFGDTRDERVAIVLRCAPLRQPVADTSMLERISVLAGRLRGELEVDAQAVTLLVPVERVDITVTAPAIAPPVSVVAAADAPPAAEAPSGVREAGQDVRGLREREHGQPRPL